MTLSWPFAVYKTNDGRSEMLVQMFDNAILARDWCVKSFVEANSWQNMPRTDYVVRDMRSARQGFSTFGYTSQQSTNIPLGV